MASPSLDPIASLSTALSHARRLLNAQPDLALAQAREILRVVPRHAPALLIAGEAHRAKGEAAAATLAFRAAAAADPKSADAWRALGDQLHLDGDGAGGDAAYLAALRASTADPALLAAADALADNDLARAEPILRSRLKERPTDIGAIRMLAELAGRIGRNKDAETLLRRALELAPGFAAARHNLAIALHRQGRSAEAIGEIDKLLHGEPGHPSYINLKAAALARLGEYQPSIALYRQVLVTYPNQPKVWMSLGHSLKTIGQQEESVEAYRRALELEPTLGEAWWSLANLKTVRFEEGDLTAMRRALSVPGLSAEDRFHLQFALGKAEEDAGDYASSFAHYAEANRQRRALIDYDPDELSTAVDRQRALFTPEFFAERAGWGAPQDDPIFVVSLPRSGSTLIEQILASHSGVEGTTELPDIAALATRVGLSGMAALSAKEARALGEEYLERTRIQRKTDRPRFVDKMPNNWAHVGFIKLILPNATVIDARRHPLGCCFSNFKQHFARGQTFTYDLRDIAHYYADYVRLMDHFDAALPGYVHRVFYEAMVEDTESQVRAILAHARLPFEPATLRFHETDRAVRTASSEQVRRPIFREGMEQWRHFEPWLDPLKEALGSLVAAYPDPA
ncbi:sulfotransferase family protein [Sphingomonas crusticola]|uniref:sulfotransferase n=1 Tax=Sphingomonas crusticola TaxID=1697973 RepID=UPI000E275E02|nr:sulfotransferase [Sphingomonas crusticola]